MPKIAFYLIPFHLLVGLMLAHSGYAQTAYPSPQELFVNDFANRISQEDAANIRQLLADLKEDTGIEGTVVTIHAISDYQTGDETIESFATALFNKWGIGDKEKNNGVLLLVAINDRQVRIEVGSGYGDSQNDAMQEVISEHIIPSFRREQYSQGIYQGVRAIVGKLTGQWPPDLSASGSASLTAPVTTNPVKPAEITETQRAAPSNLNPWVVVGGAGLTTAVTGFGIHRYRRYRKRRCPDCQTMMVRLDETEDDLYLDSGQQIEELLNAIDYDVWQCPQCNFHTLHSYRNWLSGRLQCPQCRYHTVVVTSTTLIHPTYTATGEQKVTQDCHHCDYHHEAIVILPRKQQEAKVSSSNSFSSDTGSSSSSSNHFGGGSSSGGGASGSW